MAITFVQFKDAEDQAAAGTISATFTSVPESGNCVIVGTYAQATNPATTVTDDMGNTYHKATSQTINSADLGVATTEIWYAWNISVAGTHTITFTSGAGHNSGIIIHEFSGVKKVADPLDGTGVGADQTTPPVDQTSVTVVGTTDLLFGWGISESFRGSVLNQGATFTNVVSVLIDSATGWDSTSEYKILLSSGVKTVDWDNSQGGLAWIALGAGFLPAPPVTSTTQVIKFGF
jgi:hypothetical protein